MFLNYVLGDWIVDCSGINHSLDLEYCAAGMHSDIMKDIMPV